MFPLTALLQDAIELEVIRHHVARVLPPGHQSDFGGSVRMRANRVTMATTMTKVVT